MPLPTMYDETTFAAFVRDEVLREVATVMGWTTLTAIPYPAIATESVLAYGGIATVGQATDIAKLRAFGRREAWRAVMEATAADYDFGAESLTTRRSQVHQQAAALFRQADAATRVYAATGGAASDAPSSVAVATVARW